MSSTLEHARVVRRDADPTAPPPPSGLTSAEAAARLRATGPNAVPERRRRPFLSLLRKLSGPVPWMLEAALVLELWLGRMVEAAIIAALLLVNAGISALQERRAEGALALIRARLRVIARVLRDGSWSQRPAEELVPGDVVHVRVGDLVPADLRLFDGAVLLDQSALTGESGPVEARAGQPAYSGAVVRRGEASGEVVTTGTRTYFGKTAELVESARSPGHLEQLIVGIVKYLVALDGLLSAIVLAIALVRGVPLTDIVPFVLMLLVASVPVALPATFTLATALGSLELSQRGLLVTRLSALEDAAAMEVLCSDKTGTLTQNRLSLASVRPLGAEDEAEVVRLAALACDEATQDPLDLAVLRARGPAPDPAPERVAFTPFDPETKRAEAVVRRGTESIRVVKGAPQAVAALLAMPVDLGRQVEELAAEGRRVLAVAAGPPDRMHLVGLLGFEDPPREDAPRLIQALRDLGVRVILVTGDTLATARAVAKRLGIGERAVARGDAVRDPSELDVCAGVLPEDKFSLVRALQKQGRVVGMTGDGVNDAPALKQADVGVAVATAVDVAKAAASVVLTDPGLGGVLAAVDAGRRIYQRMLTYTLNKIVKTFEVALFLSIGFFWTGTLVVPPRLVLLLLLTNDFVTMSLASDRVRPSPSPDRWRVRALVAAALGVATAWLALALGALEVGRAELSLPPGETQTLAFLVLVFAGQANVYLVRERGHLWRSRPGGWMLLATAADLVLVSVLATQGILMSALSVRVVGALLGAVALYALALDAAKVAMFQRLR